MKKTVVRKKKSSRFSPIRNVVPDLLDLRDRLYTPTVSVPPSPLMKPRVRLPVLSQENTNACTGFALANVVNYLLQKHRGGKREDISPFMLYSMARRYDEFPGSPKEDTGSSLRGAMKGWYKHGACAARVWSSYDMPPPVDDPRKDWWLDAAKRPLGAYFRVDTRSVSDMHVALQDVGILYASALCHAGWDEGYDLPRSKGIWSIPQRKLRPDDGGHAFIIVGYNEEGFIIQNSWDDVWGSRGLAVLTYPDWTENAMDCWVAQLGVATEQHLEIAEATTLRFDSGKVSLAAESTLRNRELSPFIIDMENNGRLSGSGNFRTQESDVEALVTHHIDKAREKWGLREAEPMDIAIYAHGGLTDEEGAAKTAARWIPALYEARIFPIFLMWETDLWSTIKNMLEDKIFGLPKPTGGLRDQLSRFWNERLERVVAPVGAPVWKEMKQNAKGISGFEDSGGILLYEKAKDTEWFKQERFRLHLIGHSAGSIVHCHIVDQLASDGLAFESVTFLAAAARMDLFDDTLLEWIDKGAVKHFRNFYLTNTAEEQDPTCHPYGRSLLYLVSESFEGPELTGKGKPKLQGTPILGMERDITAAKWSQGVPNIKGFPAPGPKSASTTHGGFDDDKLTMDSVIELIKVRTGRSAKTTAGRRRRGAPK